MAKKSITVDRKDATAILGLMGFKDVNKYSNSLLTIRLGKLNKYMENFEGTMDGETKEKVDAILAAGAIKVEGEEPKKAKAPKSKDGKKAPKKPAKTKKRVDTICDALNKLPKSGRTVQEIAEISDKDYVSGGGESNVKQTVHHINVLLPALVNLKIVTVDGDKVKLVS